MIGLIAPKSIDAGREQGVALLAIDGKPPRAYRVGARVDQALVLQSVAGRTAAIGPVRGAPAVQLELPVLPPPATGNLPTAAALLSGASLFPEPVLPAIQPVQSAINPASGLSGAAKDADNRR